MIINNLLKFKQKTTTTKYNMNNKFKTTLKNYA